MSDVAGATDPTTNDGGTQTSTLANLSKNIAENINQPQEVVVKSIPSSPSVGDTPVSTEQPAGTEPGPEATPPGEPEPVADPGKITRLEQERAELHSLVKALGIDPDSDLADQLRSGVITADDIKQRIYSAAQPSPTSTLPEAPKITLDEKVAKLATALKAQKGDVSSEDYRALQEGVVEVLSDFVQERNQSHEQDNARAWQERETQCKAATGGVLDKSTTYQGLSDDVKTIVDGMVFGATDLGVADLVPELGGMEKALTPNTYAFVARKATENFERLYKAIFEAGAKSAVANIADNPQGVNPVPAGRGAANAQPPAKEMRIEDLQKNSLAFMDNVRPQV